MEIAEHRFEYVCQISSETDAHGRPREFMPQSRYANRDGRPLHAYGAGPFCHFSMGPGWDERGGVYALVVGGALKYVGQSENLGRRFNREYGSISPRYCYEGGQETTCRVNQLILQAAKAGMGIQLFFHETERRRELEAFLVNTLSPEWNKQRPGWRGKLNALGLSEVPPSAGGQGGHQMPCHEEVLAAARAVTGAKGRNEFSSEEIVKYMKARGSRYRESTILTHVVSRCCVDAPPHHARRYRYFGRIDRGTYRIVG